MGLLAKSRMRADLALEVGGSAKVKLLGILIRKERWGLSWYGRMIVGASMFFIAYSILAFIHPFLAVTERIDTQTLVVEGWVHEFTIREGAVEFRTGGYSRVFTTGGPVVGSGEYKSDFDTSAHVGASALRAVGLPGNAVQMVPSHVIGRDRTYGSAVALRDWFRTRNLTVRSLNIVTEDVHARRTRLLFQKAFGHDVRVGIIAARNPEYDARHWWRYSEGVRDVMGETIAYIYAKLFFHPSKVENEVSSNDQQKKAI